MPLRSVRLAMIVLAFVLTGCSAVGQQQPDIVLRDAGCDRTLLTLESNRPPHLLVRNESAEPMVVSLPDLGNSVTVAAGQVGELAIQPYVWGDVAFYCLTERDHTAAGGAAMATGFVCGIDSYTIRPLARSSGTLRIKRHDRAPTTS